MASIVDDVEKGASWVAQALTASGYRADFTPASLREIDRFFDDHSANGVAKRGGLLAEDVGQKLFALGSYIGEVARRGLGGEWTGDDEAPDAEITVELTLSDGTQTWPVQRAMKRFENEPEDSVVCMGRSTRPPLWSRVGAKAERLLGQTL